MISLENLWVFSLKSATLLSPMNPPEIPMNSAGNPRKIPGETTLKFPLNFPVDSRFTDNPSFSGDSPPPKIHHHQGFPAKSARFCPLGLFLGPLLVWQDLRVLNHCVCCDKLIND